MWPDHYTTDVHGRRLTGDAQTWSVPHTLLAGNTRVTVRRTLADLAKVDVSRYQPPMAETMVMAMAEVVSTGAFRRRIAKRAVGDEVSRNEPLVMRFRETGHR